MVLLLLLLLVLVRECSLYDVLQPFIIVCVAFGAFACTLIVALAVGFVGVVNLSRADAIGAAPRSCAATVAAVVVFNVLIASHLVSMTIDELWILLMFLVEFKLVGLVLEAVLTQIASLNAFKCRLLLLLESLIIVECLRLFESF